MHSEALNTITARYSFREDRIIIDGIIHNGEELQLVLTQRLARAIIEELVRKVGDGKQSALINEFAQQQAVSFKKVAEPVEVTGSHKVWLVTHIHFHKLDVGTRIIFTEDDMRAVHIDSSEEILRNLLDILYKSFVTANWPLDIFPDWIKFSADSALEIKTIN